MNYYERIRPCVTVFVMNVLRIIVMAIFCSSDLDNDGFYDGDGSSVGVLAFYFYVIIMVGVVG